MREEDTLQYNYKNQSEKYLVANTLCFIIIPLLCSILNYKFAADLIGSIGLISIANILSHQRNSANYRLWTTPKYFLMLSPYIALFSIAIIAFYNPLISELNIGENKYFTLDKSNSDLLASAASSLPLIIMSKIRLMGIMAIGLSIYFINESKLTLAKISFYVLISSFIACLIGFLLHFSEVENFMINIERLSKTSFFSFATPQHWSVYAILSIAISSFALSETKQSFRVSNFFRSKRFLSIAMMLALLFSIYLANGLSLYLAVGAACLFFAILPIFRSSLPSKRFNKSLGEFSKYAKHSGSLEASAPIITYTILCLGLITISVFSIKEIMATQEIINVGNNKLIAQDLAPLMEARQIFGWGDCSFSNLFAFVQSSDLGNALYAYAPSDLTHALIEGGYVGLALTIASPIILFIWAFFRKLPSLNSLALIIAVATVITLMFYTNPMQSQFVQSLFAIGLFMLLNNQKIEN